MRRHLLLFSVLFFALISGPLACGDEDQNENQNTGGDAGSDIDAGVDAESEPDAEPDAEADAESDVDPDPECVFDSDCPADDLCVEATCKPSCDSEEDCIFGEVCVERSAGDGAYCAEDDESGCTTHSDCNEAAGEFCDQNSGECIDGGGGDDSYYTARIHDVTSVERCNDTTYGFNTAGAKLMSVLLLDDGGTILGAGDLVEENLGTNNAGDFPDFGFIIDILDGTVPSYSGTCPDRQDQFTLDGGDINTNFHEDAVAPIGCDGEVYVQFRDDDGNLLEIEEGFEIEVNEYGTFCSDELVADGGSLTQSGEDAYNVSICTDMSASIDLATCDQLNTLPAFGQSAFLIEFD